MQNGLYPIIRRHRRPFVLVDDGSAPAAAPAAIVSTEPVTYPGANRTGEQKTEMQSEESGGTPATTGETPVPPQSTSDAKTANKRNARQAV